MNAIAQRRLAAGQKLFPRHIKDEVLDVLSHAASGRTGRPQFLTAYQILIRLRPLAARRNIETHYGASGQGARHYFGAASCIARACRAIRTEDLRSGHDRIEITYLDPLGLKIGVAAMVPELPRVRHLSLRSLRLATDIPLRARTVALGGRRVFRSVPKHRLARQRRHS